MIPSAAGAGWLDEIIQPRTDAGIAFQAVVVLIVAALLFWPAYQARVVTLWLGTLMVVFGLFGMRAFH